MVRFTAVYEPESDESASETVIRAVADARDVHPAEMDACLYDAVDPDALDALFAAISSGCDQATNPQPATSPAGDPAVPDPSVSFSFAGLGILVDANGRVHVSEHAAAADATGTAPTQRSVASARSR